MKSSPSSSPLLFEDFLVHLRRLGFSIGVDHHLRLQQLVSHICGRCSPEDLKSLLCPLFAANEKQQEAFYSAFDSFFSLLSVQAQTTVAPEIPSVQANPAGRPRQSSSGKWFYFSGFIVVFALLIGIAVWKSHILPPPEA